jgi:hypothetical protein
VDEIWNFEYLGDIFKALYSKLKTFLKALRDGGVRFHDVPVEDAHRSCDVENLSFVAEFIYNPVHHILSHITVFSGKRFYFPFSGKGFIEDLHRLVSGDI